MSENMSEKQKAKRVMSIAGVVILLGGAWLFFGAQKPENVVVDLTGTTTVATTTEVDDSHTIEVLEPEAGLPFDIYRPINFPEIIPEASKGPFAEQLDAQLVAIENDPKDVNKWVELGRTWKMVDDYEGAELAWLYAEQLSPTFYIPQWNLANLYKDFIGNTELAEEYFLKVVESNPEFTEAYRTLYTIYRYDREDMTKAVAIVEQGLTKNPRSTDLLTFLGSHYKEMGNSQLAKSYYTQALQIATADQNTQLIDSLEKEIYSL